MKTFLLTWNPKRWWWDDLSKEANQTAAGKMVSGRWSCGTTKQIQRGDRIFLVRLGVEPKGIIGSAWAMSNAQIDKHWDTEKANQGKQALYVDCEWERIVDPDVDLPLSLSTLQQGKLSGFHWTPQGSGIRIPDDVAVELEKMWAIHLGASSLGAVYPDDEIAAFEGEQRIALVRHRKREQSLRDAKVTEARKSGSGRLKCEVPGCGFDFESVYGELGRDYVQVHHLKPLGDRTTPSETKLADLAVVCANCHAMIHRGGKCRELVELISLRLSVSAVK